MNTKTKENVLIRTPVKISEKQLKNLITNFNFKSFLINICNENNLEYKVNENIFYSNCPFESEKGMSFIVNLKEGIFACMKCGKSGNVIDFIRHFYNVDFLEAVFTLINLSGKTEKLNWYYTKESYENTKTKLKINKINKEAAKFFIRELYKSDKALEYAKKRNFTDKTIKNFGIGYDPDWSSLKDYMINLGYSENELYEAGLLGKKVIEGKKIHYYDFFANRLIIPIFDETGNIAGFGGRTLEPDFKPKYINSRQTKAYDKSQIIYGFNFPKNEKAPLVLCEGYMDVIALRSAGFPAIATLGTALTPYHVELLKSHRAGVVLAFDGDNAGREASERAKKTLVNSNYKNPVYELFYNTKEDPDEIINKENGIENMRDLLNNAVMKGRKNKNEEFIH